MTGRAIVYCLVPRELAARLHEPLRRHFRDDESVEVVIERRETPRRPPSEGVWSAGRRGDDAPRAEGEERRRIRSHTGRRVSERRAALVSVPGPELPRRARSHAGAIAFVERLEPSGQQLEDADSAALVNRIQSGDRDAFGVLYMRYFDRVYSYFRVSLRDAHAAEELAQHVFVKVFDALPRFERRRDTPFRAWLFTIVRNETVREVQRRLRNEVTDPATLERRRDEVESEELELPVPDWLTDRELVMFFERLPLAHRQVLMLRYMLNFGYPEIAAIMDRTEVDVRSLHSRGLRFLRARLGQLEREVPRQRRHGLRARVRWARVASSRRWALHG